MYKISYDKLGALLYNILVKLFSKKVLLYRNLVNQIFVIALVENHHVFKRNISSKIACYLHDTYRMWGEQQPLKSQKVAVSPSTLRPLYLCTWFMLAAVI